jgi:hypothetical protein
VRRRTYIQLIAFQHSEFEPCTCQKDVPSQGPPPLTLFAERNIMTTRRQFIVQVGLGSAALVTSGYPHAANGPLVAETDPQAVALGYKNVAAKADKVKFPKYANGQLCSNCAIYLGKAGDPQGPCQLYVDKQVLAGAWCTAYVKKPV